jgi:hypothetical protein
MPRPKPEVRIEGTTVVVGKRTRIRLRFLEQQIAKPGGIIGETTFRVKVRCHGCGREKSVARVGLRVVDGAIDLQPNCVDCRGIMNARARRAS